ncbi:UNVERIFIED_CONTAM: acetyl esterase/lipase [Williamsia faeni]
MMPEGGMIVPGTIQPDLEHLVDEMPALDLSDVPAMRLALDGRAPRRVEDASGTGPSLVEIEGPAGSPRVPLRITCPDAARSRTRAAIIEIHGGGFVLGSAADNDAANRELANATDAVVVSVDYRLAPEHPHPAAVDDCYAALLWVAGRHLELGIDPARIGILGASAGAYLAATTALRARDQGGPALACQALLEPVLDNRCDTTSMQQGTDTVFWTRALAERSWELFLAGNRLDSRTIPARHPNLTGLPPTYLTVNELDPLRDQGLRYAERLRTAAVPVDLRQWHGTFHGFTMLDTAIGHTAIEALHAAMSVALAAQSTGQTA